MHPCNEMLQSFVSQGLIQPWDTSLLPSFKNLNPFLVQKGQINGKQYMIPWDWGYASLLYRTDKIDPADATGWELAWNPKYKGKIALWNGSGSNMEVAALKLGYHDMDTHDPEPDPGRQADPDRPEAAEQVLLVQRVRPDAARRSSPATSGSPTPGRTPTWR